MNYIDINTHIIYFRPCYAGTKMQDLQNQLSSKYLAKCDGIKSSIFNHFLILLKEKLFFVINCYTIVKFQVGSWCPNSSQLT